MPKAAKSSRYVRPERAVSQSRFWGLVEALKDRKEWTTRELALRAGIHEQHLYEAKSRGKFLDAAFVDWVLSHTYESGDQIDKAVQHLRNDPRLTMRDVDAIHNLIKTMLVNKEALKALDEDDGASGAAPTIATPGAHGYPAEGNAKHKDSGQPKPRRDK